MNQFYFKIQFIIFAGTWQIRKLLTINFWKE